MHAVFSSYFVDRDTTSCDNHSVASKSLATCHLLLRREPKTFYFDL